MTWLRSSVQIATLGFCVLTAPDIATAHDEVHLSYEVSLAGLSLATADLDLIVGDSSYVARMQYRTSGAARLTSSGAGEAIAKGAYKGGRFVPATFDLDHRAGQRSRKIAITIVDGRIKTMTLDPPIDPDSGRMPFELDKLGTIIDPLSATVVSGVTTDGRPETRVCDRTLPIFDGIRRYDIELSLQGSGFSNRGIFIGPLTNCRLRLMHLSAEVKPENATQSAERGARLGSVDVTFGFVAAVKVYVPVAISAEVGRATLVVRLIQISTGGARTDAAR
ncbi:DUF3108 domain-containing protein [Bradyrhizobium sp. SSUT77]|uniref:DUF3108 domain-containing protein n=1 Tax=Bradyrhizobium sp. SSUT77 TaxID=3040603 RepID=UPI002448CE60|nr:DUF3108 domain-containing protein [Bradyrhizobium sp. SSUT77]MDH2343933.1 DUF3108 domain-containing protein [Bradyrhizobium sp. SSUT77]